MQQLINELTEGYITNEGIARVSTVKLRAARAIIQLAEQRGRLPMVEEVSPKEIYMQVMNADTAIDFS